MCQRGVYLYLAPAISSEEFVYLKLAYCLQAYPFGAYLTCISMLDGIHVNEAFSLLARLFHRGLHCVYAAVVDHLLPELLRLSLYEAVVARQGIAE